MKLPMQETSFLKTFLFLITLHLFKLSSAIEFGYKNTDSWAKEWPTCGGRRQSPVDLSIRYLDDSQRNNKIKVQNYEVVPKSMKLLNNGHSVKIVYQWGDRVPIISGEALNGEYRFDSLHFHWDTRSNNGSEHTFQGRRAAMEIHYLHHNVKYGSVAEALNHDDGFAVIGDFLFTEPLKNNSVESPILHRAVSQFPKVPSPGNEFDIEPFSFASLAPPGADEIKYIVYPGSLTVPPCSENVMWMLNTFVHLIDERLLNDIRNSVQLDNHDDHNFRETQPLNGRRLLLASTEGVLSS